MHVNEALDLISWRARIFALYERARAAENPVRAWEEWKKVRDEMFRHHPQSPISEDKREEFQGAVYYEYDPAYRVTAEVEPAEPEDYDVPTSTGEQFTFQRVGTASFNLLGSDLSLELYWLTSYAGGLFVPFRDETSGKETYGAGRYLLDTIKGSSLGTDGGQLVFDFNFAYNPSCSYDPKWACPLAPPANRLEVAVEAGEKHAE